MGSYSPDDELLHRMDITGQDTSSPRCKILSPLLLRLLFHSGKLASPDQIPVKITIQFVFRITCNPDGFTTLAVT